MEFEVDQIFTDEYPPEAAEFCNNAGNLYIEELDRDGEGKRLFQIKKIPCPTQEELEARVRAARDARLAECDKINPMRWATFTEEQQEAWKAYRQALCDIPQQEGFPWGGDLDAVPWPEKPEG